MRIHSISLAIALVLTPIAGHSQQSATAAASSETAAKDQIAPGTLIQVEVISDVDVKKAHAGDTFRVRLWEDVRSGGKVVLPQKTILVGHVVAAQPRSKDDPESKLTIAFDKAILKGGAEVPLQGVVERVQLSQMAATAAAGANASYNPGLNPGSTTNIAMPSQQPSADRPPDSQTLTPGPTNIRDPNVVSKADVSGMFTVISSTNKNDVKLKRLSSLDIRITHSGN